MCYEIKEYYDASEQKLKLIHELNKKKLKKKNLHPEDLAHDEVDNDIMVIEDKISFINQKLDNYLNDCEDQTKDKFLGTAFVTFEDVFAKKAVMA